MTTEEKKTGLLEKIFLFQKLGIKIKKNETGAFKNKYATLDQVWSTIENSINDLGMLVFNTIEYREEKEYITTYLYNIYDYKDFKSCAIEFIPGENPQKVGSAITYYRRYNLCLLLNLIIEGDDDDGNVASNVKPKNESKEAPKEIDYVKEVKTVLNKEFGCKTSEEASKKIEIITNKKRDIAKYTAEEAKEDLQAIKSFLGK